MVLGFRVRLGHLRLDHLCAGVNKEHPGKKVADTDNSSSGKQYLGKAKMLKELKNNVNLDFKCTTQLCTNALPKKIWFKKDTMN